MIAVALSKMANIWRFVFIAFYLLVLTATTINLIFPLYFMKCCGINTTWLINTIINRLNGVVSTMLIKILGIKFYLYQEKGKKITRKDITGSVVVLPNHWSELDGFFTGTIFSFLFPRNLAIQYFVKSTVRFYPVIGWIGLVVDAIHVKGTKRGQRQDSSYFVKQLKRSTTDPKIILIFPEGSRNTPKWKKEADEKAGQIGARVFNTVMPCRTSGLNLIHNNTPDISAEYWITMQFVNPNGSNEMHGITPFFFKGYYPEEVHMIMIKEEVDRDKLSEENRKEFDESTYDKFAKTDNNLGIPLSDWDKTYDKSLIVPTWRDYLWMGLSVLFSGVSVYLCANYYYWYYICAAVAFYNYKAYTAFV